jgi:hypothetical protein
VCGIIIGLLGLLKLYNAITPQLPGCTTDATATVIRDIFKSKNVELTVLYDLKTRRRAERTANICRDRHLLLPTKSRRSQNDVWPAPNKMFVAAE